jgi:hypothetical protein
LLGVGLALALSDRLPEALVVAVADCVSTLAVAEPVMEGVSEEVGEFDGVCELVGEAVIVGVPVGVGVLEGMEGAERTCSVGPLPVSRTKWAASDSYRRQGCAPAGSMPVVLRSAHAGATPPKRSRMTASTTTPGGVSAPALTPSEASASVELTSDAWRNAARGAKGDGCPGARLHSERSASNQSTK